MAVPPIAPTGAGLLAGGGEMGTLIRSHEWEKSSLGAPDTWPQSLRTVVNILITSRYSMWMGWGDELTFLYNDAYRPTLGLKHPWALGKPAREVWKEIWAEVGPRVRAVLSTGVSTYDQGLLLFLERSGFPEETYHTFSYSPLADDAGGICGMLCVVTEETDRIISERRMATLRDLAAGLATPNTESEVLAAVGEPLAANPQDLPFTLVYLYDDAGAARLAYSTGVPNGHSCAPEKLEAGTDSPWPAEEILRHSATRLATFNGSEPLPRGAWGKSPEQAVVVAIRQQGHECPAGFLIAGINPFRRYDQEYSGFIDLVAGQLAGGLANARAYQEERRRTDALAELDRAKTAFFSNVSHEFRTPLTLMLGPVDDLLSASEAESGRATRKALQLVQRNGLRLQRLVNALLDFSRIEAGRVQASYQPTDLAVFTGDLASSFRSAIEKAGMELVVDCPPLSQPVYVDREMWEKVVLNLISNAFKYTLEGSVRVSLAERGGSVVLSVADTGVGIPPEELPRLFERFHRVEQTRGRTHEGTGIGLALVQELVKLHDGSVSVESSPGVGSTFSVTLCFGTGHLTMGQIGTHSADAATVLHTDSYSEEALRWLPDSPEILNDPPASAGQRHRVLLADDNADMREYVRRLLSVEYEVVSAANGVEALSLAVANPPDLVLSDIMMPQLDGFGLLRALRANPSTRTIPVILLSARAGEEASVEGLQAGADDYLVKPFSARELMARVGAHLALRRERQRASQRLVQVFSQAPVGIVVFRGEDFVVELANPVYQALLPGRELIGRPFAEVVPELNENVWAALRSVLETGQPFVANDFEVLYDHNGDGIPEDHWFNVVYHPLGEADGTVSGIVAVLTEVTVQVLARQELERANRELEEFAYVSSHDLQEPLRMISIYSQLLLRRHMAEDEDARKFAGFIRSGVLRMEELISDLLTYSRTVHPEQEPARPANLNKALDEALTTLTVRLEETGAVISRETLPLVSGEERQLTLVFQNLLSNAMKYAKADTPPMIRISARELPEEWVVSVSDDGIGFDEKHAERIFGLFKRLHKDAYPGTGLGLAICKRIVERYGGRIRAESSGEGHGATFWFSLRKTTA